MGARKINNSRNIWVVVNVLMSKETRESYHNLRLVFYGSITHNTWIMRKMNYNGKTINSMSVKKMCIKVFQPYWEMDVIYVTLQITDIHWSETLG